VAAREDGSGHLSPRAEARAATVVGQLERMRPDAFAHARRVADLSVRVARYAHLPEPLVLQIYWGGLVHDIGELNVQPAVLLKGSAIDERERIEIGEHTIVGARWLAGVPGLAPLVPFARWHHERFDGLGYPDGATSEQVPLAVALVGACDAWDALTESRPHREPFGLDDAVTEMRRHAGHQWSRAVVTWLIDCVQSPLPPVSQ
jgi:HD-GYP domain-containing protein (c-di-GMP phosphodiesterase class II)